MSCEIIWQALEMAWSAGIEFGVLTSEEKRYFWMNCVCMA